MFVSTLMQVAVRARTFGLRYLNLNSSAHCATSHVFNVKIAPPRNGPRHVANKSSQQVARHTRANHLAKPSARECSGVDGFGNLLQMIGNRKMAVNHTLFQLFLSFHFILDSNPSLCSRRGRALLRCVASAARQYASAFQKARTPAFPAKKRTGVLG